MEDAESGPDTDATTRVVVPVTARSVVVALVVMSEAIEPLVATRLVVVTPVVDALVIVAFVETSEVIEPLVEYKLVAVSPVEDAVERLVYWSKYCWFWGWEI